MTGAARTVERLQAAPYRVDVADSQLAVLRFARQAFVEGGGALGFLVDIRGGAARSLGAMVAIDHRGGYCGYVSGGCVEAAVAAEALQAMDEGRDRDVLYGEGSPFFDIILPCGGGLTVAIHVLRELTALDEALDALANRFASTLVYRSRTQELLSVRGQSETGRRNNQSFHLALKPDLRLAICGEGSEARALANIASAAGYATEKLERVGKPDPWTAVIFLRHDIDSELDLMVAALQSDACYIGALGSRRTHQKRIERLLEQGISQAQIERIHAPIGLFGPTRHSSALALSILAEIASLEGNL
jgi:xanthine dehydrogenase accessory factor